MAPGAISSAAAITPAARALPDRQGGATKLTASQPQKCNSLAHHMQKIGGFVFPNLDTPDTVAKL
jgi:hypothetical protein